MNDISPVVAVLMSTYNGGKFIREQLDSIFIQSGVEVRLFVRDDGSSDNTVDILEEYARYKPMIIVRDGDNVGPGESFLRLVYKFADEPGIEYYAFADQDDIWLKDKLSVAVERIAALGDGGPVLYSSNQYLYIEGENKGNRYKEKQNLDLISHITKNTISGCTFVFNKKLAQLVSNADRPDSYVIKYRLHDSWLMLVAIICGRVIYDETSHMLYRIHSGNVVGIRRTSTYKKAERLVGLLGRKQNCNLRMMTARELLRLFPKIRKQDISVLELFANYKVDIRSRLKLLFNRKVVANCLENPIIFRIKVLIGVV